MKLVIDGFNVIYKFYELEILMHEKKLEVAIDRFTQYMINLKIVYKKPIEIFIFYDGKKKAGDDTLQEIIGGVNIYYTHNESADALIEDFLRHKKEEKITDILVITSDKKVQKKVKSYKYNFQTSEDFYDWYQLQMSGHKKDLEKPEKINNEEMKYWLNLFKKKKAP